MTDKRIELFDRTKAFVSSDGENGSGFNELCLEVFEFQYEANAPYRRYCEARGITPWNVTSWIEIPAYPTEGFKKSLVTSFPVEQAVMAHITGGSTCPELRGRVFRDAMGRELALACNVKVMGEYLFPEGKRMPILVLAPSPDVAPTMGLALGMAETIKHFGDKRSGFFITRRGMRTRALLDALRNAEWEGKPVAIIGATGAFVYLFGACREQGVRFHLPPGSRIVDGGGYRGKFGERTRGEYYADCFEMLGVPEQYCLNVLGMAECTTNFADNALKNYLNDIGDNRYKLNHSWARVVAYDMETCSRPLPDGEVGLLRHFDLANLPTVIAVQTDNLGYTSGDGFEIIGRARVVDGKVSPVPSEKPVGPMGERKIFALLDVYTKFSIRRHVAKLKKEEGVTACTCGEVVEDMIVKPKKEQWEDLEL